MGSALKTLGKIGIGLVGAVIGSAIGVAIAGPAGFLAGAKIGGALGFAASNAIIKPKLPSVPLAQLDRLNAGLNPTAPRTGAFGETALGTDIRYIYPSGTDQRYIDYIIGVACHKVESIDELWIEDRLAWSSSSGYASWTNVGGARLTVATRTEGTSGNAINIGGAWTGSARLTGCAYIHVRIDRQGTKKTDSPFSGGLASRLTIKGKGMPLYDPRLDTTRGGSGSHRADDQTTWGTTGGRNNPALQILAYLIGWRISGKLSVGRGVPLDDIDFDSFITAANACDEDVTLAGGGTQNRYETAGMFSEGDDADTILNALAASCNGELRDYNGRIGLFIRANDLAVPVASFSDQNILSGFRSSTGQVSGIPNLVRGRYTDPSNNALYQLVDYPEVSISSPDGIERVLPLDLPYVQDGKRAQRIAKQALQRAQYSDTYEADFDITALKCGTGDVVEISFEALGWTDKLFRVVSQSLTQNGRIAMQLRVENEAIYAWDEDETAPVAAAAPTTFDPLNAAYILAASRPIIVPDTGPPSGAEIGDEWVDIGNNNKRYILATLTYADETVTYAGTEPWYWIPVNHGDYTTSQTVVSRLNSGTGNPLSNFFAESGTFPVLVAFGEARDGDVVTFDATLPVVPRIQFGPGGIAPAAGENVSIRADGLTVSGFTMVAKAQAVTAGSTVTDTGSAAGGVGEPDLIINRSSSDDPYDGRYTFSYRVFAVINPMGEPGIVEVGIFVKKSGIWVQVGSASHTTTGDKTTTIAPGDVDFGAGSEFGISNVYSEGAAGITNFYSVRYTPGTGLSETSLTPAGSSSIPWEAYL